jgi:hypothetical protein
MLGGQTNRRTFIAALGRAAAWPLVARAQQLAMRTVLGAPSPAAAILQSLKEEEFTEAKI